MKMHLSPWLIVTLWLVLPSLSWAFAQPQTGKSPAKQSTETAKAPEAKKPARSRFVTDLSGFDLLDPGKTKKQTMVAGATRAMPRATALAPKLAKLYGTNPVFRWTYPGKTSKFIFVLMDDNRAELLRSGVSGTEFRYALTTPQFAPGKSYFWTVEPASMMLAEPSTPVGFVVTPAPERLELEQRLMSTKSADAYAAGCQRAQIFTDERLWYDAIDAYTDLIARYPDRAELYEKRGTIYAQFETTQPLGDNDFARAEELEARR
jgi:hypothetical protein